MPLVQGKQATDWAEHFSDAFRTERGER